MRMDDSSKSNRLESDDSFDEGLTMGPSDSDMDKKPAPKRSAPISAKRKSPEKTRRKRKPPKIPWKKPIDMPRRPLSAYNLFFRHEREQLLRVSSDVATLHTSMQTEPHQSDDDMRSARYPVGSEQIGSPTLPFSEESDGMDDSKMGRQHQKSSGIGFANLAKTIASKWKTVDPTTRAKFEALAATEKARYNKEMLVWRQKKKDEADAALEISAAVGAALVAKPSVAASSAAKPQDAEKKLASPTLQHVADVRAHPLHQRRLSDPFPQTSHHEAFPHQFHDTPIERDLTPLSDETWGDALDGTTLGSLNQLFQEDTLHFREGMMPPARSYSDSTLSTIGFHHIRSCEEIVADAVLFAENKDSPRTSVAQSSLRALGSSLDEETVDFLTNLKFD